MDYHKYVDGKYWLLVRGKWDRDSTTGPYVHPAYFKVIREANFKKMAKRRELSRDLFNKRNRQEDLDTLWKNTILERTGAIDVINYKKVEDEIYLVFETEEDCAKWLFLNG